MNARKLYQYVEEIENNFLPCCM